MHGIRLILIAVFTLLMPVAVFAQSTAPLATTLTLEAGPGMDGRVQVKAHLVGSDGKNLGMQTISLRLGTDFFGNRPLRLSNAVTDSAGIATFQYMPSWDGEQQLLASYAGSPGFEKSSDTITYLASGTTPSKLLHANEPSPLTPVWRLTALAATVVTLSIWAILVGTLIWVRVGIRRLSVRA